MSERSDLKGRRIALVGGAGFLGHSLAIELKQRGADVVVVDGLQVNNLLQHIALPYDYPSKALYIAILEGRMRALESAGVPVRVQDAREYDALSRTLGDIDPHVVVHLAAVAHGDLSDKDPMSTFGHSLHTLENTLDYASRRAEHFVYFSSSMVYGNFQTPSVSEDHPTDPIGIYGALKLSGEKIVIAYRQVFGLEYTIIRPSALYGPGCVSRRVSQQFIERALAGRTVVLEGDGEERLDFSYIDDVVDGVARAIVNPAARDQCFNIAAGNARSLNELIACVREHFPELEIEHRARDPLRPVRGTLTIEKARSMIGYEPQVSLEEGVDRYVAWYRELVDEHALAL